ncbi:MAG: hypothetical protein Q9P90_07760 [candidate division KSB1 bacterium]|nr:hypothetical protein [candidate division KSB1 bacterium]
MRKNAFWLLLLPVFFMACEKQPNLPEPAQFPEIVRIFLPERAFLADTTGILVHARIFDPQGPADLSEVTCRIQRPDGSEADFAMRDDGLEGDILAGDGQFAVRIPGAAWSDTGRGEVRVFAVDRSGNRAESEPRSIAIVPGKSGAAPVIQRVTFPDTVWADINYQIPLLVQADDPDGLADIAEIQYAVYAPGRATTSIQGQLLDDGNNDDGVAGNGTYGAIFASDAFGVERGVYSIVLRAIDKEGNRSPGRVVIFVVQTRLQNLPPEIVSISVPDTVSRSQTGPFVITCTVTDPNGLGDIARVYFNSYFPDGTPSSGNPFLMRDDGKKDQNGLGDAVAGDGVYSLTIGIGNTSTLGTFRFEFQAEDKSGQKSEIVVHRITVVE